MLGDDHLVANRIVLGLEMARQALRILNPHANLLTVRRGCGRAAICLRREAARAGLSFGDSVLPYPQGSDQRLFCIDIIIAAVSGQCARGTC